MPKQPVLPGTQIVRALERLGFRQVRQRGSHVVMRKGDRGCSVPMHKEVRTGALATIIRQAELSDEAFFAAVR